MRITARWGASRGLRGDSFTAWDALLAISHNRKEMKNQIRALTRRLLDNLEIIILGSAVSASKQAAETAGRSPRLRGRSRRGGAVLTVSNQCDPALACTVIL